MVKFRLSSTGQVKNADGTLVETNIFSEDQIRKALELSLSAFNSYKEPTNYSFEEVVERNYSDIITLHACITLLEAQALMEKGREYVITDGDCTSFQPAILSDFLIHLAQTMWHRWCDLMTRI